MTNNMAKIREALEAAKRHDPQIDLYVDEAFALLDAEDKPSVPMAMLEQCAGVWRVASTNKQARFTLQQIADRFGFAAKE